VEQRPYRPTLTALLTVQRFNKNQEALGKRILELAQKGTRGERVGGARAADVVMEQYCNLPDNPKDFPTDYKERYLSHLQQQGDRYSLEMREAIIKGEKLEEDPCGT